MRAVGVIVEYNPFHNGHAFHLEKTKEVSEAEIVVAVMSGQFLQRGEPALLPKWERTEMALLAGVDIVFELPYQYASQKAETFASGAVSLLASAGCSSLCFGSESGDISAFINTYEFLYEHNEQYQQNIKIHMEKGVSYPKAASLAYKELTPTVELIDLSKPNNILGFHYVKAVLDQKNNMSLYTVSRKNANYHDEHFASATIASATSIRKSLFSANGDIESVNQYVPRTTHEILLQYYKTTGQFQQWENYWPFLQYRLIHSSPLELRNIYEIEEGLENRLISAALKAESFFEFMNVVKTKRYTWTRLQRACVHILVNTRKEVMQSVISSQPYLRLLGMTERGRDYLNKHKSHIDLPIVSKLSSFKGKSIELDIKAARIYALGAPQHVKRSLLESEFNQPPIYVKKPN